MHQVIATQLKLGEQDITAIQLNPVPKAVVTDFSPLGVGLCIVRTLSQTATRNASSRITGNRHYSRWLRLPRPAARVLAF